MTYLDDLHAERFTRSTWWDSTRQPRPVETDSEFDTAKRRRDLEAEVRRVETGRGVA